MVIASSCKKQDDTTVQQTTPGSTADQLNPDMVQNPLLIEGTGTYCGWCPSYGTETIKQMIVKYPNAIAISLHSDIPGPVGTDKLKSACPINTTFLNHFPGLESNGIPNFYVGNTEAGQSPESKIISAQSLTPTAGVKHLWTKDVSKYNIQVRIKFFAASSGNYYIGTYALQDNIAARKSLGLDQHDYANILQTTTAQDTTRWKSDQAPDGSGGFYFKKDERYYHDHVISSGADGVSSSWGQLLSKTSYNANDTLNFNFTITPNSTWAKSIDIVTILWKKNGSTYSYINGYRIK